MAPARHGFDVLVTASTFPASSEDAVLRCAREEEAPAADPLGREVGA